MGHTYVAVGWNRQKRIYDLVVAGGIALYLAVFVVAQTVFHPDATIETSLIRALGTCAFFLLHVVLSIGPLARIDRRFLPLLYNRRHLGVSMFLAGAAHGALSLVQFHALSDMNPLVSVLVSDATFQPLGAAALVILFLMAATSHDFWLANLTAPVWKSLHMGVYLAYALLVAHVALGALQAETSPVLVGVAALGLAWIVGLHLVAAAKGRAADQEARRLAEDGWVDVGDAAAIPEGRAIAACIAGETVAVYRYDGKISALSGICRHQNGPLAEGRIVDGCVTCPWHGYQYRPDTGGSPPPFTETVATFDVRVVEGRVHVNPRAHPPGTRVAPALIEAPGPRDDTPFYVGYLPAAPGALARFVRRAAVPVGALAIGVPLVLVLFQAPFAPARFEYARLTPHEGTLREGPVPLLETQGAALPLVAPGKHGAAPLVAGRDGRTARLEGKLIERAGERMIEVAPGSLAVATTPPARAVAPEDLGTATIRGEIVDGKCFLGVMNPGSRRVHRACAIRCISGGAPPILYARDRAGEEAYLYLVGSDGRAVNREVLPYVAEPVEVTGRIRRLDGIRFLYADPAAIRRLP